MFTKRESRPPPRYPLAVGSPDFGVLSFTFCCERIVTDSQSWLVILGNNKNESRCVSQAVSRENMRYFYIL